MPLMSRLPFPFFGDLTAQRFNYSVALTLPRNDLRIMPSIRRRARLERRSGTALRRARRRSHSGNGEGFYFGAEDPDCSILNTAGFDASGIVAAEWMRTRGAFCSVDLGKYEALPEPMRPAVVMKPERAG